MEELRLRLYDTLSAEMKPLVPRREGEVSVYCCGPTTYDVAHVGHARAALAPDILVRHLRSLGLRVTYVRNVTDVDDKILKRASESGEPPMELSLRMAVMYAQDMQALGCLAPDVEPKVSQHIGDIIAFVEGLIARGAAYVVDMPSGAKDVYYSVRAFPSYGKLSKRNIDDLCVGARIEASEVKRDPLDFALWKGCLGDSWGWDSPWGKGRPGWHIECSAMSSRYLGHGFDVHAGGMDLVFPHHENEIAQSEALCPNEGPFVRTWIHNGFVNVDKEKMAKSLGNFVTIRDVYDRNDPEALRYFLLGVHYRGPIAFETDKLPNGRVIFPGVQEAERRVDYLYLTSQRLTELKRPDQTEEVEQGAKLPKELAALVEHAGRLPAKVKDALDEDLNTPMALAALSDLSKCANEFADLVSKRKKDAAIQSSAPAVAAHLLALLRRSTEPLGLLQSSFDDYKDRTQKRRLGLLGITEEQVRTRLAARNEARRQKDFAQSDAIRKELEAAGIEVSDLEAGTTFRVTVFP